MESHIPDSTVTEQICEQFLQCSGLQTITPVKRSLYPIIHRNLLDRWRLPVQSRTNLLRSRTDLKSQPFSKRRGEGGSRENQPEKTPTLEYPRPQERSGACDCTKCSAMCRLRCSFLVFSVEIGAALHSRALRHATLAATITYASPEVCPVSVPDLGGHGVSGLWSSSGQ